MIGAMMVSLDSQAARDVTDVPTNKRPPEGELCLKFPMFAIGLYKQTFIKY